MNEILNELMDNRSIIQKEITELTKVMASKSDEIDRKIKELNHLKDDMLKNENDTLKELSKSLDTNAKEITKYMDENNISKFSHSLNLLKYIGTRKINILKAEKYMPKDIYLKLLKKSINVLQAEKALDEETFNKIVIFGKKKLSFLKPLKPDSE